jgi:hypothetical protein
MSNSPPFLREVVYFQQMLDIHETDMPRHLYLSNVLQEHPQKTLIFEVFYEFVRIKTALSS